jgi:putative hydrolase of the HAD superfamily
MTIISENMPQSHGKTFREGNMATQPSCIFFDVDDTLYPPERGVWTQIGLRINRYLVEKFGIPEAEAESVRRRYFAEYGTTCNGLRAERRMDPRDYYRYVHDIPLEQYLEPDPALREMLESIPQRKFIFSNADRAYILRVLSVLGVADEFDGIVDIFATEFACKPMEAAYRIALEKAGSPPADRCMLVDDLPRNLVPARGLGWATVLVHTQSPDSPSDRRIETIHRLPEMLG